MRLKYLSRPHRLALGLLVVLIASISFLAGKQLTAHPPSPESQPSGLQSYRSQVNFVLFTPNSAADAPEKPHSIELNTATHVLSYGSQIEQTVVTVSMQATPEGFVDVAQAFDKLVEKMNQYSSFESLNGKVYLTKPQELNGGQTAVMNAKGTLLFAKPASDLSDDQWRKFFNQLDVVK